MAVRTSRLWPDGHAAFELLQEDSAPVLSAKLGQELQVANDLVNAECQFTQIPLQACEWKSEAHSEPLEHFDFPILLCRRQPEAAAPVSRAREQNTRRITSVWVERRTNRALCGAKRVVQVNREERN